MTPLIDIDPSSYTSAFGRRPLGVTHNLQGHPLLGLEALADLADQLPESRIEENQIGVDLVLPGGGKPRGGVTAPGQLVRNIERNGRWIVLWNVEYEPSYRSLLDQALDPVQEVIDGREGGMCRREAFVFISSGASVTPVHFDPEHNFLLQIHGVKEVHVGRFSTVEDKQRELERYYSGGHRNIEHLPEDAEVFRLEPGRGVYVPSHAPHWVANKDDFCISLSITFHTRAVLRRGRLHVVNHRLRRLGLSPVPPEQSKAVDGLKLALHRSVSSAHHLAGRVGAGRRP